MQEAGELSVQSAIELPAGERIDFGSAARSRALLVAAVLCALLMLPVAWNMREGISTDGLSYLEVAVNTLQFGIAPLLSNGYWSPGYPALVAAALGLFHPSRAHELIVVHSLDWLIWAATCLAFTWFLSGLVEWIESTHGDVFGGRTGFLSFAAFAYTLLFIANIDQSLWYVGPNILTECAIFLAAGVAIRLGRPDPHFRRHIAFGSILGLAYVVKAALFPLSAALLAMLLIWPASKNGRRNVAMAAAVFLLTASPFVTYLSHAKGRLTFGDSGNLAYAWYVNGSPRSILWQATTGTGILRHPAQRLSTDPPIVKFDGPYPATLPYWYDPSWWYDGVKAHFNFRQQVSQYLRTVGLAPKIMSSGSTFGQLARRWTPLWPGLAVLVLFGLRARKIRRAMGRHIWLLLWPAFAVFTFATVLIEYRYLFPFFVLAAAVLFAIAWVVTEHEKASVVVLTITAGLWLSYGPGVAREIVKVRRPAVSRNQETARNIAVAGVRPGDQVATVGWPDSSYFIRLAGARITIQMDIADPAGLQSLPEEQVGEILSALRANGAAALFSQWRPAFDHDSGWIRISDSGWVRPLR